MMHKILVLAHFNLFFFLYIDVGFELKTFH